MADITVTPGSRALFAELKKIAAPLVPESEEVREWFWFSGTRDDARACELLRGLGLPGDPGQNKTSWTAQVAGRRLTVMARGKYRIHVQVNLSAAEAAAVRAERADAKGAEASMKKAADFDRIAADAEAALKELPATEEEFRAGAKEMMWRLWTAFLVVYGSRDCPHASGFRFDAATMDTVEGYIYAALWAVESDGSVVFDEATRTKKVRAARAAAARHDAPVQCLLKAAAADAARELQASFAATRSGSKPT